MNTNSFRLVFSRLRGMLVAVEETATGNGKAASGETTCAGGSYRRTPITRFALRHAALAAMLLLGAVPALRPATSYAQIVAAPGSGASVIQTPNGLPQVNVARPSGAGVSINTYSQFDVQKPGAILNNSPVITGTQLAGQINGNPNFAAGQYARIIVNQVNSSAASQINGPLEVAGARAQVVIANGSGISVNGGSFINTSRATLTTGTPNYGPDGSLTGFDVRGGQITVQGDGLNASNIDQVDLIARSVAANAKLYANTLNVVTGANHVDHDTLTATPIAGDGPAPAISIDVSQLGGMYANRIVLASNEFGVGVSNRGVIAAQAGDLTLTTQGRLVLTGSTSASGNMALSAHDGIDNSGTTYAQQSVSASTAGDLNNSGTLAAQQNTTVNAGSVNSTGTLGAGINSDGSIAQSGDLAVTGSGAVSATGRNAAGGNAALQGGSVNLAGSQTSANGTLALTATIGDLNTSGATTTADGTLSASAAGTLTNDHGSLSSGGAQTIAAGALSNRSGQIVSGGTLAENVAGAVSNQGGTMQAAGALTTYAGSLDNTGGHIASLNADGLGVTTTGLLNNGQGGTIGGNGNVTAQAGQIVNAGSITAAQNLAANAALSLANSGTLAANGNTTASAGTTLTNAGGTIEAEQKVTASAATLDNSVGAISADQIALHGTTLVNHGGSITQTGTGAMAVDVSGTLDNADGGTLQTNSTDLTLAPATLINDGGTITHAGTGTLTLAPGNGSGTLSNAGGNIASNGRVVARTGTFSNTAGAVIGQTGLTATVGGALDNTNGRLLSNTDLSVTGGTLTNDGGTLGAGSTATIHGGSLTNRGGSIVAPNLAVTIDHTLDNSGGDVEANQLALSATDLLNHGGTITQYGASPMAVNVSNTLDNSSGGTLQTNSTDLTLAPATLINDSGTITHAGTGTLTLAPGNGSGTLSNAGGNIASNGTVVARTGTFNNTAGVVMGQTGLTATVGGALDNTNGKLLSNADLALASGTLTNDGGEIGAGSNETISTGSLTNNGGAIVAPNLSVTTGTTLDNSGGDIETNQLALSATDLVNHGGTITQYGVSPMTVNVSNTLDNSAGGTLQTNSTDLTLAPATLINDGGSITHAGTGTLTLAPGNGAGTISNVAGNIISAGQIVASAGGLNNSGGVFAALGGITASVAGNVNNSQGLMRSLSSLWLHNGGVLTNANGRIQSGTRVSDDASTLDIQSASVDNSGGLVGNLGTGTTSVQGANAIINSAGTITGNGDVTLGASSLVNTQGGQLGGANLRLQGDTLDNSGGQIGNIANGDVDITTTGALTNTNGRIGATHDLSVNAGTLYGGGAYSAVNNVSLTLQGDFSATPAYQFNAGNRLAFTLPGTFSNAASLLSINDLGIDAGTIENSGTIAAGGLLATHSNTLTNTGVMVGASVSLAATGTLSNVGPTALIGASDSNGTLELLANDIENRDDTTATDTQAQTAIYGLGKVVLAGGKDANGNYTNAALIRNQSALIESGSDMELHADQVTNTRRVMTTTGSYSAPVDPALIEQLGISLSGCTATYMAACGPGNPQVLGSTGDPSMIGGVPIDPPHGGQWNSSYQYTTYTGVALANLITGISPSGQIIAGGNLDASSVGLFQNYWSQVAAVGNIALPATLDQNSWRGQLAPGVQVTYSGQYHYNNYDNTEHNWQLPFGDAGFVTAHPGGYTQAAPADIRPYALPAYESSFDAGGTLSGSGVSIDNTAGNASLPSLGLLPGQSLGGVNVGAVSGSAGVTKTGATPVQGSAGVTKTGATSVQGGAAQVDPVIARATAVNVVSNLTVPQGGLFKPTSVPGATYLIETNPAFTNARSFLSSDYYLQQLGLNPQTTEKRLGDGFYEQQLVRNQITSLTGKAVLGPYTDLQSMYEALLGAGAGLAQSLDLPLGMSLSPAQVAALTSNVIIMQTEVVDGQSVLVPVVYLAQASQQNMNGPLIAATDVNLQNTQTFTNSGTVQASNSLTIDGKSIDNAFGALKSGGLMSLTTTGDVNLTSAKVSAGSLALNAGGNLLLNTATNTLDQVSATGATRVSTTLGPVASLNVTGDAVIVTGGNFEQNAGNLSVGGNLGMAVGGNWDLGSVQTGEHKVVERANGVSDTNINSATGSSVNVGGVSAIGVGGDLTARGAQIDLGDGGTVAVNGNVSLGTASATSTVNSNSAGSDSHGSYAESLHQSDQTLTGTTLHSGDTLTIASGKDITLSGSAISLDKGNANLLAVGDVNVGAATETHTLNSQETHSHSGVASSTEISSGIAQTATLSQGSLISADGVMIAGGRDINVAGSTIVGTNDVALSAARDVTITTSQDTQNTSSYYEKQESGFGTSGGIGISYGSKTQTDTSNTSQVTNNGSTIGSLNGSLAIAAGNDLHVTGSALVAAQNITGTGANVTIDAATDTMHHDETQVVKQSGFTLAVKAPVLDALSNTVQQSKAAGRSQDSRAAALHGIAAASGAIDAAGAAAGLAGDLANGTKPEAKVELSYGSSSSTNTFTENSTTQKGSSVSAGGTAAFVASGNGAPGSGNVTIAGSNVSANDVLLAATNQVNLLNTTDTDSTRSTNQSSSASVGISYGTGGWGVDAAMSKAGGNANSDAAMQNNTHVTATNGVTIISGGDTNIIGSDVSGKQVTAAIGGNLNIASVQDTLTSSAHQESSGGGFSVSMGGGSASFSSQHGDASGNYAGVNEQAGIQAGTGGFDITVKGNTDLKGAVITSAADASQNTLTTGTLSFSDIQNSSNYNASSSGFSAGASVGNGGNNYSTQGSTSGTNTGGGAPLLSQHESGSDSATTKSGISAGTINVTDTANQQQDLASLNRDTSNTNGTVAKTPDVSNLLNQQADTMGATSAAGEAVSRRIGDYADSQGWAEGSLNRALMQAAGAALVAGLGGGNALGAAAGAGLASIAAGNLNDLSTAIAGSNPTGNADMNTALGNIVANVIATGAGAAVGGNAGAFSGYNVDRFNRQLHPEEATLAKQLADKSGGKYTPAQIEDQMRLMGVSVNGMTESGAPATLIGSQTPTDSGAQWTYAGTTANGQPILTQTGVQTDPQLQAYIMANYNSAAPGGVPSAMTYTPTSVQPQYGPQGIRMGTSAGSICPNGNCGIANGATPTQQQLADAAGTASSQLGVVSATAAAVASRTAAEPYISNPAAVFSIATGAASFVLGGVQQVLSPNVGQYLAEGGVIGYGTYVLGDRYPLIGPIVTQVGNMLPNLPSVTSLENAINTRWQSVVNGK